MTFTLLTYNVLYNKAFVQLSKILKEYQPDIVCLQEVETTQENLNKFKDQGYVLADYANCFINFGKIYGVATFYKPQVFRFINSKPIPLTRGLYEGFNALFSFLKRGVKRTILLTDLYFKTYKKTISVYNVHLSAISLNQLRLKQLNTIDFARLNNKNPLILTGDFNFPIERKKLEKIMNKYHLKEATNKLFYTIQYPKNARAYHYPLIHSLFTKIVRKLWTDKFKLDYIFYRQLTNILTKRIDINISDHFPIFSKFEL